MADPFVAEIRIFPFNFAPKGWAWCDGQLLPISQNTALFSLVGTYYGGDGESTFGLPDLQGRTPMQWSQGPGLSDHAQGETGGAETVTLLESEIPNHSHPSPKTGGAPTSADPAGNVWSSGTAVPNQPLYGDPAGPTSVMADAFVKGGAQPHNNLQPYLTMYFCIALQGIYPPR